MVTILNSDGKAQLDQLSCLLLNRIQFTLHIIIIHLQRKREKMQEEKKHNWRDIYQYRRLGIFTEHSKVHRIELCINEQERVKVMQQSPSSVPWITISLNWRELKRVYPLPQNGTMSLPASSDNTTATYMAAGHYPCVSCPVVADISMSICTCILFWTGGQLSSHKMIYSTFSNHEQFASQHWFTELSSQCLTNHFYQHSLAWVGW